MITFGGTAKDWVTQVHSKTKGNGCYTGEKGPASASKGMSTGYGRDFFGRCRTL